MHCVLRVYNLAVRSHLELMYDNALFWASPTSVTRGRADVRLYDTMAAAYVGLGDYVIFFIYELRLCENILLR